MSLPHTAQVAGYAGCDGIDLAFENGHTDEGGYQLSCALQQPCGG
jgi:hypothetical protein